MSITRRIFLRNGALAVVGTTALPSFLTRAAFGAADPGVRPKRLVVIFQRGAADGLNIVVPHAKRATTPCVRPSTSRRNPCSISTAFSDCIRRWRPLNALEAEASCDRARRRIARPHAVALRCAGLHGIRHARIKITDDGWLNRALQELPSNAGKDKSAFRAIAFGPSLPRILSGKEPAVAVNNLNDFSVGGKNPNAVPMSNSFEAMYDHSVDSVLHGTGQETFDAVKTLKAADPRTTRRRPTPTIPRAASATA